MRNSKPRCGQCGAPNEEARDRCRICGGPLRDLRLRKADPVGEGKSFKETAENEVQAWGTYEDRAAAIKARHQQIEKVPGPSWVAVVAALIVGAALVFAAFNALVA